MTRNTSRRSLLDATVIALTAVSIVSSARASEFFEKNAAALRGYDAVAYFTNAKPIKGSAEHKAEYKGSTFHFSSEANREAFMAEPTRYAPQYGGFCAFGMSKCYKAATDPGAFTFVNGKPCLTYNEEVHRQWNANIPGFVAKADKNWPAVAKQSKVSNSDQRTDRYQTARWSR